MRLSVEFISRIIGAIFFAILFGLLGQGLGGLLGATVEIYILIFGLIGILAGLVLTPALTVRPLRQVRQRVAVMSPERLIAIIIGTFLGLVAAALLSLPLSLLPSPFGQMMPLLAAVLFCYLSVVILILRQKDLSTFVSNFRPISSQSGNETTEEAFILLDTSVIIDGRILDIAKTGFLRATLLVPNFILLELQHIADSSEPLRRNRGRRGLEVLSTLQNEVIVPIKITDMDVTEVREADSKLVSLARHLHCPIMTNDYNLNRVAELQGVTVLNINDLANAVKADFLPGEGLRVKVIQEGREQGQGVGFLADGTMVVVEDGRKLLNQTLNVTVTKVLQTSAGRMIFAKT